MPILRPRPADDFATLRPTDKGVRLPGGLLVRLAQAPDGPWEFVNQYGVRQGGLDAIAPLLQRNSYDKATAARVLDALQQITARHTRQVLRYAGALIWRLYLDREPVLVAQAERAARLCRLFIRFWEQDAATDLAQAALPALWRTYRDALTLMTEARDSLLAWILADVSDPHERSLRRRALLGRKAHVWLSGWERELDDSYAQAQSLVADQIAARLRTVEIRVAAGGSPYLAELRVDGWNLPAGAPLELDPRALDGPADAHAYGRALGELLFAEGALGPPYREVTAALTGQGEYPAIRLRIEPPELRPILWERIYHPWAGELQPLATSYEAPFSRVVALDRPAATPRWRAVGGLQALIVIASPADLDRWGLAPITEAERARYRELFAELPGLRGDFLESGRDGSRRPSLAGIQAALSKGYDLLLLVCHGRAIGGDYRLLLEGETGEAALVPGEALVAALDTAGSMPLVVLAACEGGEWDGVAQVAPLGHAMVAQGVAERAVAMNGRIGVEAARRFTFAFYRQLGAHGFVELAVNAARRAIHDTEEWWAPILFSR